MIPFIIETEISELSESDTGLMRPGLVYERWLPFCLASRRPIFKTTFSNSVQWTGINLGKFTAPRQQSASQAVS